MIEKFPQSFPHINDVNIELFHFYVISELNKVGIAPEVVSKEIFSNTYSVTTSIEIPKETKSKIHCYATQKGFHVNFLTKSRN